jgi:ABC-type lipoprotein export system ATPase subunit
VVGVMRFFEGLNRQDRMTIVFVTHDTAFAHRASRQIAMKDGVIA